MKKLTSIFILLAVFAACDSNYDHVKPEAETKTNEEHGSSDRTTLQSDSITNSMYSYTIKLSRQQMDSILLKEMGTTNLTTKEKAAVVRDLFSINPEELSSGKVMAPGDLRLYAYAYVGGSCDCTEAEFSYGMYDDNIQAHAHVESGAIAYGYALSEVHTYSGTPGIWNLWTRDTDGAYQLDCGPYDHVESTATTSYIPSLGALTYADVSCDN